MLSTLVFLQTLRMRLGELSEKGQGLAEYSLILGLVFLACLTALSGLGSAIATKLTNFAGNF